MTYEHFVFASRTFSHEHEQNVRDAFTRLTWLIPICDVTHSHVGRDSFTHVWRYSFTRVWRDSFTRVCVVTHSRVCVTWLIHTCVWRNGLFLLQITFMRQLSLYCISQITFMRQLSLHCISLFSRTNEAHQKHFSFDIDPVAFLRRTVMFQRLICVTRHIRMCDMTHVCATTYSWCLNAAH